MERLIALDTHVAVWLHAGQIERFPKQLCEQLDSEQLVICPIVLLELQYLFEIERITCGPDTILADLQKDLGLIVCTHPFAETIRESIHQQWTRDPFDRMIAAHAVSAGHLLATKDAGLLLHCPKAFWDQPGR